MGEIGVSLDEASAKRARIKAAMVKTFASASAEETALAARASLPLTLEDIGDIVRDRDFDGALALLSGGGFDGFDEEWWMERDAGRRRTPIVLICDRQYRNAKEEPHAKEEELIAALISAGCPLDSVDDYLMCALGYAASSGRLGIVKLLLAAGADIEASGAEQQPLARALVGHASGCAAVSWALLEAGAKLDEGGVSEDGPRPSVREAIDSASEHDREIAASLVHAFEERKRLAKSISVAKTKSQASRI